jgi:hypothetical protein
MSTGCYFSHGALLQSSNVLSSVSAVPPKVEDAFKIFRYVPYSALTLASRIKAARGEEEMIFNAQGGLTVKSLDRRNEKSISAVDWHAAARAAEERIRFHHGDARASAFIAHHKLVMDLGRSHNWEVAMEYDIQQREVAALNPSHDLSSLDLAALTIIATRPIVYHHNPPPSSSPKRSTPPDSLPQTPRKRHRAHCFRCGGPDHLPADCKADVTVSGKPTAKLAPSAKSKHALLAPNGKQFCFTWARNSSCSFSNTCTNAHCCSICGEPGHGAGSCKACA